MYIKDSSFYDEFRDPTEANLWLIRPSYDTFTLNILSGTGFMVGDDVSWAGDNCLDIPSGIFERNPPLLYSTGNEELTLEPWGTTEDFLRDASISHWRSDLGFLVIYSVDENGVVLAPPGVDRVTWIPAYVTNTGYVWGLEFKIPASETGFSIESMHMCVAVRVDPDDISSIIQREKNDIILSSIPYHNLEVELFDTNRRYADIIEKAGDKLRVLLQFQYNQVQSKTFVYYYDEQPTHDKSTAVPKTKVKFAGLSDVLAKSIYVNSESHYEDNPAIEIPGYLKDIAEAFRSGNIPYPGDKNEMSTPYGGRFLKLESYDPFGTFGVIENGELTTQTQYKYYTRSPADGYSYADAFRLLVNAQCHGMRITNETICEGKMERLIKESKAVFTNEEYYSVPQKSVYENIDQVRVNTAGWGAASEEVSLPTYNFAFRDGGKEFYVGDTLWVAMQYQFDRIFCGGITVNWKNGNPFSVLPDVTSLQSGSSGITLMWVKSEMGDRGFAPFTVSGLPLEKRDGPVHSKRFGNGTQVLEINNPFMRERMLPSSLGDIYDIVDEYMDFNYKYQSRKTIYTLETRGRFDVHPLDKIQFVTDGGDLRTGIVIEHEMKYNGAMRSTFRVVDDGTAPNLYASETAVCSKTLLCREEG